MPSLGYVKDALALVAFCALLLTSVCLGVRITREWLQLALFVAICFDGAYTLVPGLHNTRLRDAGVGILAMHLLVVLVGAIGGTVLFRRGKPPFSP